MRFGYVTGIYLSVLVELFPNKSFIYKLVVLLLNRTLLN